MPIFYIFLCLIYTYFCAFFLNISMPPLYIFPKPFLYTSVTNAHSDGCPNMTTRHFLISLNKIHLPVKCKILWYFWSKERLTPTSYISPFAAWLILSIYVNNMAARPAATVRQCSIFIKSDSIGQKKSVDWGGFVERDVGWSDQ